MQPIHVLFGTESNNSADLADRTADALKKAGFPAVCVDMAEFDQSKLPSLSTVLVVTSTYGNGDPPSNAEDLHAWLMKKAPSLPGVRFAVCALGDKTYDRFCQCGKDFDRRLGELGATRLVDRKDCDVDYEKPWKAWLDGVVAALKATTASATASTPVEAAAVVHHDAAPGTRRNPAFARVIGSRRLCGTGSTKETIHVELELPESLVYEVGDSLGVFPTNDPALVAAVLRAANCDGATKITLRGAIHEASRGAGAMTLEAALSTHLDLAHVDPRLTEAVSAPASVLQLPSVDVLEVLEAGERPVTPQALVEALRPLAPRSYSIASSLRAHPRQAHFTIDVVRYAVRGRMRGGVASTMFADRAPAGTTVPVYLHAAPHFRLPDDAAPIVMIGPGTGIAPFRAFLEERLARGARGQAWLFFGARNAKCDALYQSELATFVDRGILSRLDLAWSRDQEARIYVQDRMREAAPQLRAWIDAGAIVYVCGDAKKMAHDVHRALAEILGSEAKLEALDRAGRYRRDVY
jgi:sulfite reductase (NADPH) flavoprotein alpha-component